MRNTAIFLIMFGGAISTLAGGEVPELEPRPVALNGITSLNEAVAAIAKQTGNRLVDERLEKVNRKVNLALPRAGFWQALDGLAREADLSFSPYRVEGAVAITDGPYRAGPVSHQGLFRTAVKSVSLHRDLETNAHTCTTLLELAWEPRFQPFYMDVGTTTVVFAADAAGKKLRTQAPGTGKQLVAQRIAIEVPVPVTAPARSSPAIESLAGKVSFIGPSKMLAFKYSNLRAMKNAPGFAQEQEGVAVQITQIAAAAERWSFDVVIRNPPGGPEFESFQHWLHNNQIYLEKNGTVFRPNAADEQQLDLITAERAAIRYHFSHRGRTPQQLGQLGDWMLVYHTPGKIVEVSTTFDLKNVPLP